MLLADYFSGGRMVQGLHVMELFGWPSSASPASWCITADQSTAGRSSSSSSSMARAYGLARLQKNDGRHEEGDGKPPNLLALVAGVYCFGGNSEHKEVVGSCP